MTATAPVTDAVALPVVYDHMRAPSGRDLILHADNLNAMVRVADLMAKSRNMVPKHLRDNPGGCLAVTMQAMRWNMDPFALSVKTYVTSPDSPVAYEGQAIMAALNNSPLLETRLNFEWYGDWHKIIGKFKEVTSTKKKDDEGNFKKYIVPDWKLEDEKGLGVRVIAKLVGETEPRTLELLMTQCRTRNSGLWTEDPKQQISYLASRRWGRLHTPDVIMGVYTPDELEEFAPPKDMGPAEVLTPKVPEELLKAAQAAADKGRAVFGEWWKAATVPERNLLQNELADLQIRTTTAEAKRTVDNGDKGTPVDDQKTGAAAPAAAAAATVKTAAVDPAAPTAASIEDKLIKAKTLAALDIAADWIKELNEPDDVKKRLGDLYDKRHAELAPK